MRVTMALIHEAVLTMLALDRAGAEIVCLAPDRAVRAIDHRTGSPPARSGTC
jgi:enhancing lycopene biosynthesis protein 2